MVCDALPDYLLFSSSILLHLLERPTYFHLNLDLDRYKEQLPHFYQLQPILFYLVNRIVRKG